MGQKGIRRATKSLGHSAQRQLTLACATEREIGIKREAPADAPRFKDADPLGLFVGPQRIDVLLKLVGFSWVFTIRRLMRALDWTPFYAQYSTEGRPAYHPALMGSVVVLGHLLGRTSLRDLEDLAAADMRCWWLSGGLIPDYSSFCNFFNRHKDLWTSHFFEDVTSRVVLALQSDASKLGLDGTVVQSAASAHCRLSVEAAQHNATQTRARADAAPRETPAEKVTAAKLDSEAKKAKRTEEIAMERDAGRSNQQKRNSPTVVPEHDPEAVNQPQKRGGYAPSYKPSIVVTKDRVITGQTVHPSNEAVQVPDLLDQSERVTGQKPEIVMADAGYNVGSVLHEAVARDLNFLCPQGRAHDAEGDWAPDSKRIHKSQFKYHEKTDSYTCPQGRVLTRLRQRQGFVQYRSVSCEGCPLRAQCIKEGEWRSVNRAPEDEIREALFHVMQQPGARRQYKRRQGMVEPVFAELKGIQGETRFRRFGLANVRAEHAIHCAVHNIRRVLARARRPAGASGRVSGGCKQAEVKRVAPAAGIWRTRQKPAWHWPARMSR
jgi:Transposase DDE domain/Transposase domain (DUF772)